MNPVTTSSSHPTAASSVPPTSTTNSASSVTKHHSKIHSPHETTKLDSAKAKKIRLDPHSKTFEARVNTFVQKAQTNQLTPKDISKFYKFIQTKHRPISTNDLSSLRAIAADPNNPYHDDPQFQKLINLSGELASVLSTPIDTIVNVEERETAIACAERDGVLWHCYDRKKNETGGYTYLFKLREEYDDVTEGPNLEQRHAAVLRKSAEMYPAIEPSAGSILPLSTTSGLHGTALVKNKDLFLQEQRAQFDHLSGLVNEIQDDPDARGKYIETREKIIQEMYQRDISVVSLGYETHVNPDGIYLEIPDRETLLTRWNTLRTNNPDLPPLSIASGAEIMDDNSFAQAFLTHDTLLSTGSKFVSDSFIRVIPTLKRIQNPKSLLPDNLPGPFSSFTREVKESGKSAYAYHSQKLRESIASDFEAIQLYKQHLKDQEQQIKENPTAFSSDEIAHHHLAVSQIPLMEASLKALTDTILSKETISENLIFTLIAEPEIQEDTFSVPQESTVAGWRLALIWHIPEWANYFKNRFGEDLFNIESLVFTLFKMKAHYQSSINHSIAPVDAVLSLDEKEAAKIACAERDGVLWHCYDRKKNETGGYTYLFKLREEYDDVTEGPNLEQRHAAVLRKTAEMYPAVEPSASTALPSSLSGLRGTALIENKNECLAEYRRQLRPIYTADLDTHANNPSVIKNLNDSLEQTAQQLYQRDLDLMFLGWKTYANPDGTYLEFPDQETLLTRWDILRTNNPQLPALSIASGEGIADDLSFVQTFLIHDALLSTGKEFVHDSFIHVFPTLQRILQPNNLLLSSFYKKIERLNTSAYIYQRQKIRELVKDDFETINFYKRYLENIKTRLENDPTSVSEDEVNHYQTHAPLIPLIEASLGALVDSISSKSNINETLWITSVIEPSEEGVTMSDLSGWRLSVIWVEPKWINYLETRFGKDLVNLEMLISTLTEMKTYYQSQQPKY